MTVSSHLSTLLTTRKVVLWVEDTLTKEYLLRLWQPDDVNFNILVAGGSSSIYAVVHDLREDGFHHVFGLVDRDFGNTNQPQWGNRESGLEVFRPRAFELENYLLDWQALAGCQENQERHCRAQSDIAARAENQARKMVWWMSCGSLLADYHEELVGRYPPHPKIDTIQSQRDAEIYITTQNHWHGNLQEKVSRITNSTALSGELHSQYHHWNGQLNTSSWSCSFSGREIFRVVRGFILDVGQGTPSEKDTDLAKSVANWQRDNQRIPRDLQDLLQALKTRVGTP